MTILQLLSDILLFVKELSYCSINCPPNKSAVLLLSPSWNQTIGVPEWVHQGSVANIIKNSPGTIGYAELDYALTKGIPFALVKNPTGNFIAPLN
jgi:ABC-type phosphate transport system substrate-binding protein